MSRSYKYNPDTFDTFDEQLSDEETDNSNIAFDDSQLSTGPPAASANSAATGDLSVTKLFSNQSSKERKRADRELRKQRRHDERQ